MVLGSDLKKELSSWKEPEKIRKLADLLFIPRKGYLEKNQKPIALEISSSEIRKKIRQEESVKSYLTPAVWNYIKDQKLYHEG